MSKPITICAVSYLNTRPFIHGIHKHLAPESYQLVLQIPSLCAQYFAEGRADIALIPVAALLNYTDINVLPDFCIGANGKVDSVFLFAHVPIKQIECVHLDKHSRTSNGLTKILFQKYWKKDVIYRNNTDFINNNYPRNEAGVIIGDRTFNLSKNFAYQYDLAECWYQYCQLPFCFAVWVYNKNINQEFIVEFKKALELGIFERNLVVTAVAPEFNITLEKVNEYLFHSINYHFDDAKKVALKKYLVLLSEIENLSIPNIFT